jgi:hypothetical protein
MRAYMASARMRGQSQRAGRKMSKPRIIRESPGSQSGRRGFSLEKFKVQSSMMAGEGCPEHLTLAGKYSRGGCSTCFSQSFMNQQVPPET